MCKCTLFVKPLKVDLSFFAQIVEGEETYWLADIAISDEMDQALKYY